MTSSQLEFQLPSVSVNGVAAYVGLVSVNAPGGVINWVMDGGGQVTGVTGLFQFTDSNPLPTRAFYRVVQITPP